jgi:Zn finger protein HypA/HybF involved in hydrogenase expression
MNTAPTAQSSELTDQNVEADNAMLVPFGVACRHCALDLKQQPASAHCPDCAKPIRESMPGYTIDWNIEDSRPCLNCEYDLVGQPLNGVCPECGTKLTQSINGNLLRYSGYTFVESLKTGVKNISRSINSITLIYVYILIAVLLGVLSPSLGIVSMILGFFVVLGGIILAVYFAISGWWKLSESDPCNLTADSGENQRRAIRASLIIYLAMIPVSFITGIAEALGAIPAPLGSVLAMAISMLSFTVLLIATMRYIQRIAYRVPSVKLRKRARTAEQLMMSVVYGYILLIVAVGALFFMPSSMYDIIAVVAGVAGVLVGIGSLFGLVYFTRSLSLAGRVLTTVLETTQEPSEMTMTGGFGLPAAPDAA